MGEKRLAMVVLGKQDYKKVKVVHLYSAARVRYLSAEHFTITSPAVLLHPTLV